VPRQQAPKLVAHGIPNWSVMRLAMMMGAERDDVPLGIFATLGRWHDVMCLEVDLAAAHLEMRAMPVEGS
jgi:hypothetical protein